MDYGKWKYLIYAVHYITAPFIWTYDKGEQIIKKIRGKQNVRK